MKKITLIALITLFIASCGGDKNQTVEDLIAANDLEKIRTKRAEVLEKQLEIDEQLKQLDNKISSLDSVTHIPLVTTFTAEEKPFNHYLELQGNITTKNLLVLYPEYSGILTKVYVKKGQQVNKGQLLATIDDGGMRQQLSQAEIQTALAKTTFERQARLWDQKIGSEIQYLQAKSSYEAQAQAVSQIKQQLGKTNVRAPFSGTIDDIITEQGSVVGAGQSQLMRIVNLSDMYIETEVPERYLNDVTKNREVLVEIPVIGKTLNAKIRQTANFINPSNRTFKVEIGIPNKEKDIKPNLSAKLKINDYSNQNAYLIPQSIISENANGEQYVYVVQNINSEKVGTAKRLIITTGRTQGDIIEVLTGLDNGSEIIQEGARSVKDGQIVEILKINN